MSAAGFLAYNAAGTQTVNIAAADGSVSILGTLKSGTSGKRLEINPTATYLPELRFYANNGTDYGYINGSSVGSDVNLGMNSSQYDDGTGTQVISRAYLTTSAAEWAIIRADNQIRRGGYALATAGSLFSGFTSGGVDGGQFYADSSKGRVGWNPPDSAGQYFDFTSGRTRHVGQWADYFSAGTTDGVFTADEPFGAAGDTVLALSYGPTMASTMVPMVTLRHPTLRTWQVTASSTTGFTVTVGTSSGTPSISVWSYRV